MNSGDGPGARTKEAVAEVKETAKQEGLQVASSAADTVKQVAGETATQAKAVAQQAKEQVSTLLDQTRNEVRETAEQKGKQAAAGLRTFAGQLRMLADGQPGQAGSLQQYVQEIQQRVAALADHLETKGPQGIIEDATRFARRRPALFLAAAMGTGFAVGRLVRAGSATSNEPSQPPKVTDYAGVSYPMPHAGSRVMTGELSTPTAEAPNAAVAPHSTPSRSPQYASGEATRGGDGVGQDH